jgi:hypothetical protein
MAVRSGLDTNGNGTLEDSEVLDTEYLCVGLAPYATGWASSSPLAGPTGEVPDSMWYPSGRKASILKTSASSRLKVTVSDNLRTAQGVNRGYGYYEVRMNGGRMSPACSQGQLNWNASGWTNNYHFPFATVCLTDTLPAGLYEFETWVYTAQGTGFVGAGTSQPLVFVEEIPETARYGFANTGAVFATAKTSYQRAPERTVTYSKRSPDTLLKVTLADTFGSPYDQDGGIGWVMVRMDDADTTCYTGKYDEQGTGGDFHNPFVMTCVLPGVPAGPHTFSVWIRSGTEDKWATLGWERSSPLLLVEEIANERLSYRNSGIPSGELSGTWAGVRDREVQHTVSAVGKTLRVTYSDTFSAVLGCNGKWGFFQLYVDGSPTSCSNGQYAYNSGEAGQVHHHPINHVCLVKGLPPKPHTFSIWSTTLNGGGGCGSNYFGYERGQSLLLVEELP